MKPIQKFAINHTRDTQKKLTDLILNLKELVGSYEDQLSVGKFVILNPTVTNKVCHDDSGVNDRTIDLIQENNLLLMQREQFLSDLDLLTKKNNQLAEHSDLILRKLKIFEVMFPDVYQSNFLEIIRCDSISDTPFLTFKIFAGDVNTAHDYFQMHLICAEKNIGLSLGAEIDVTTSFFPKRIQEESQRALYSKYSVQEWQLILKALHSLIYCCKNTPPHFQVQDDFDLSYWSHHVVDLYANLTDLPNMFRFQRVTLQAEYKSVDYEAIALEFEDVSFDFFTCKKFQVRLAAGLVDGDNFSRFPKIEIPLVDGIQKPFESWYAESESDLGKKFEIRFALDNDSFDLKVWDKLSSGDKSLLTVFLLYLPDFLEKLDSKYELKNRSWATWIQFAKDTSNVFKSFLMGKSNFSLALEHSGESVSKAKKKKKSVKTYSFATKK